MISIISIIIIIDIIDINVYANRKHFRKKFDTFLLKNPYAADGLFNIFLLIVFYWYLSRMGVLFVRDVRGVRK